MSWSDAARLKSALGAILLISVMATNIGAEATVIRDTLDNGLTVLIKRDARMEAVAIVTRVEIGYFNEPDSLTGVSHLLEHMFFKGTRDRAVGEIGRQTRAAGGYLNGATSYEHTTYHTVVPVQSFEKALEIQADALQNCLIDSSELAKEAKVVIEEIKRKLDNPTAYSYEKLLELAFDKHNIRRWRMGNESQVGGWSREQLEDHYRKYYRPGNIIISIVGNVDPDSASAMVKELYGRMQDETIEPPASPSEPPQIGFRFSLERADINRNIVQLGYHVPGGLDDDFYALVVMDQILGGGRACRLYQEIKEKRGLAESITSNYEWFKDIGYFALTADQAEGDPDSVLAAMVREIERLRIEAPGRDEMSRAINLLESAYYHSLEDVNNQAQTLAMFQAYGDWRRADQYIEKLHRVTAEDIRRVAERYFVLENASVFEYLPRKSTAAQSNGKKLNDMLKATIDDFRKSHSRRNEGVPLVVGCAPVGGKSYPDMPIADTVLPNGIKVFCRERHSLPLVTVQVNFAGGRSNEAAADAGITELMLRSALKGAGSMNAAAIAGDLEGLGATIDYFAEADYSGFSLEAMAENFEEAMAIFAQVVLNPTFPAEEIEIEKKDMLAAIKRLKDSAAEYPIELSLQALYAGTPYGTASRGEPETISRLGRAELVNFHRRQVTTGNCAVFFVGDITFKQAIGTVNKYFRGMNRSEVKNTPTNLEVRSAESVKKEKRDRAQSAQAVSFLTCPASHPDYVVLKVIQGIVSGMGGRLWDKIRDKNPLAYSVYAYQEPRLLSGNFTCYMATSPENADAARTLAIEALKELWDSPLGEDELATAKNYMAGSIKIGLQSNAALAELYSKWEMTGRGARALDGYAEEIESVTPEDIRRAARVYFASPVYAVGMVEGKNSGRK